MRWRSAAAEREELPARVRPHVLLATEGLFSYAVRGVGPEGQTMYAEF